MASAPPPPPPSPPPAPPPPPPAAPAITLTAEEMISIWSKSIDTQMHFNEMATKSRQLGLAFVAAALGVGLVLLGQGEDFSLVIGNGWRIHVTVFVILAAVLALTAVRKLDLGVYHQMLRGAVAFGEDFEEQYMKQMFRLEKGLTQAISHFSRHSDASAKGTPGSRYTGSSYKTAGEKVKGFYNLAVWVLLASAIVLFGVTNATKGAVERRDQPSTERVSDPVPSAGKGAAAASPAEETNRGANQLPRGKSQ